MHAHLHALQPGKNQAPLQAASRPAAIAVGAGTVGEVVALIFAAIMAATAISGFCPLYLLLGRLSKRRKLA